MILISGSNIWIRAMRQRPAPGTAPDRATRAIKDHPTRRSLPSPELLRCAEQMRRIQGSRCESPDAAVEKAGVSARRFGGGGSGIRTLEGVTPLLVFKTSALNRSANPPLIRRHAAGPARGDRPFSHRGTRDASTASPGGGGSAPAPA